MLTGTLWFWLLLVTCATASLRIEKNIKIHKTAQKADFFYKSLQLNGMRDFPSEIVEKKDELVLDAFSISHYLISSTLLLNKCASQQASRSVNTLKCYATNFKLNTFKSTNQYKNALQIINSVENVINFVSAVPMKECLVLVDVSLVKTALVEYRKLLMQLPNHGNIICDEPGIEIPYLKRQLYEIDSIHVPFYLKAPILEYTWSLIQQIVKFSISRIISPILLVIILYKIIAFFKKK